MDFKRLFDEAGCIGSLHAVRLSDGTVISHDADRPHVLASVVKVPIGLEFYAQADAGRLDPTEAVTLVPESRTPGPVGISQFNDCVTMSLRDLSYLMLTISDNAATDAVTAVVGIPADSRLNAIGCRETVVVESLKAMLDGVASDLGHRGYRELVAAQNGEIGPEVQAMAIDPERIDRCRALDPFQTSRTTARDATRLLAAVWGGTAASPEACANLRRVMSQQVTRRLARAVLDGGTLEAKSGGLFRRVRNEIALAEVKLAGRGKIFVGRFEDYSARRSVELVSSFNAWHWIEPTVATDRVAQLIKPNGYLALIWTEVVSWGQGVFEDRLADVFGSPWEKRLDHVDASMQPVRDDDRFDKFHVRHHPFARKLDAQTFVAVTKTYGGNRTDQQHAAIERVINTECQGEVEKVEDAVLYIARRRVNPGPRLSRCVCL